MRVGTIARKVTWFHRAMKKFLAAKALIIVLPSRGYDIRFFWLRQAIEGAAQCALRIGI